MTMMIVFLMAQTCALELHLVSLLTRTAALLDNWSCSLGTESQNQRILQA